MPEDNDRHVCVCGVFSLYDEFGERQLWKWGGRNHIGPVNMPSGIIAFRLLPACCYSVALGAARILFSEILHYAAPYNPPSFTKMSTHAQGMMCVQDRFHFSPFVQKHADRLPQHTQNLDQPTWHILVLCTKWVNQQIPRLPRPTRLPLTPTHLVQRKNPTKPTFGNTFDQPIVGLAWPGSLRQLSCGANVNHPIAGVVWPGSLQQLSFRDCFDKPMEGVVWPASVQQPSFGDCFDRPIAGVAWPAFLQQPSFGRDFNQPIVGVVLLDSLKQLSFGDCFDQPITLSFSRTHTPTLYPCGISCYRSHER